MVFHSEVSSKKTLILTLIKVINFSLKIEDPKKI